jgi:phosphocarrier protein HPr
MSENTPLSKSVQIVNVLGMHARAAAALVRTTARFQSQITVARDGQVVNAKSILGLMTLAAARGTFVTVRCEGADAADALAAVEACISGRFGEHE